MVFRYRAVYSCTLYYITVHFRAFQCFSVLPLINEKSPAFAGLFRQAEGGCVLAQPSFLSVVLFFNVCCVCLRLRQCMFNQAQDEALLAVRFELPAGLLSLFSICSEVRITPHHENGRLHLYLGWYSILPYEMAETLAAKRVSGVASFSATLVGRSVIIGLGKIQSYQWFASSKQEVFI